MVPFEEFGKMFPKAQVKLKLEQYVSYGRNLNVKIAIK